MDGWEWMWIDEGSDWWRDRWMERSGKWWLGCLNRCG